MSDESTVPRRALRERPASIRWGDERETALLATAERLLDEGRFDDASIAEIAREAEISRPTFYFYFASKQALLNSLLKRTMDELTASLTERFADPAVVGIEAHRASLRAVADLWFDNRPAMMAATAISANEPAIFEQLKQTNGKLMDVTAEALAAGRHVSGPAQARELAGMLIWMTERNFYVLAREQPTRRQLHALADRLLTVWIHAAGLDDSS